MAELVDALDLESSVITDVWVQVPLSAPTTFMALRMIWMNRIIIIGTPNDSDSDVFFLQVKALIEPKGWEADRITISQVKDIPTAASIILESFDYDAIICVGAFYDDNRYETKVVYKEFLRSMNEISIHFAIPVGMAVFYVEQGDDLLQLIKDRTAKAIESCDELIKLKNLYQNFNHEPPKEYKN